MHVICTIKDLFLTYDLPIFAIVINFKINRMKKHFLNLALWALLPMSLCVTGCSDDDTYPDVDGQTPVAEMNTLHIQTAAGRTFTIEGRLTDADGISTIQLQCADLYLNKTIDLIEIYGEPQTEYDLSYNFAMPADEIGDGYTVTVTITDVGGRSVTEDVLVTLDGDFAAPVFTTTLADTILWTISDGVVNPYPLSVNITDDRSLASVAINIEGLEGYENLTQTIAEENITSYTYDLSIVLPNEMTSYPVTITASDRVGNSTSMNTVISITELPDYPKMYLADVATDDELQSDVFGVPMLIDHTGEYQYTARYYNAQAGTEIHFLPQNSSFSPICYGVDPTDNTKLSNQSDAEPLVLTEANVYYQIDFNIQTLEYTMTTYSVDEAVDPWPTSMVYGTESMDKWNDGGSTMMTFTFGLTSENPTTVESFVQDVNNPHLFHCEVPLSLTAGETMNFIIHNYHTDQWWNFVRWCSIGEYVEEDGKQVDKNPEIFGYYTGSTFKNDAYTGPTNELDIWSKPVVNTTGTYQFYFDSHLGRAKLVRE